MDWDLENETLKLEGMIHIYQEEIEKLETENEKLEERVVVLERRLRYYQKNTIDIKEALSEA